jgi:prophage tail gpP-like protein
MADAVTLIIDGKSFAGWTAVRVQRTLEAVSGMFEVSLTNSFQLESLPLQITPGDLCELRLGDDTIITGYIDDVDPSCRGGRSTMKITGRDKAADLVDCSVVDCPSTIKDETVVRICERIAAPYGVKISIDSDIFVRLPKFSIEPYESAYEAIYRACMLAGVVPVSNRAGGILLTRSGRSYMATDLVWGSNVLGFDAHYSMSERYQTYTVYAQRPGTDKTDAKAISQIQASASDLSVARPRTLIMHAGDAIDYDTALRRARWEAAYRAGRGGSINVTVQGWRDEEGGELWDINRLVDVSIPPAYVSYQSLLITSAAYVLDEAGTTTELVLRRMDSFLPEPLPQAASRVKKDPYADVRAATGSTIW